jgi:hypothetical protein
MMKIQNQSSKRINKNLILFRRKNLNNQKLIIIHKESKQINFITQLFRKKSKHDDTEKE